MLVPVIEIQAEVPPSPKPFAAITSVPGAATSGLNRPSLVGPWLLVTWTRLLLESRLATDTIRGLQASELTWETGTLLLTVKNEGKRQASFGPILPTGNGSSRSIQ